MKRIILPLLLLLAACGRGEGDEGAARVRADGLDLGVELTPSAPRVGANALQLELRDAEGEPVEGAALDVAVRMHAMGAMPAMGGPAHVAEIGGGRYEAHFELEMGGTWQVEVAAQPRGGAMTRAEGSLTVGTPGLQLAAAGASAPAAETEAGSASAEFRVAPERLQQIGVRMARAERKPVTSNIRAAGRVVLDERKLHDVSLKVSGWVEELRASAMGDAVAAGDVLFTLYSPELYAAQREYRLALDAQARARATGAPERADYLVEAARNRLRLWDVAPADLARIASGAAPLERVPIRAPVSGFVVEKNVVAGGAVEPGARLYRLAPLDPIWVEAEVVEADLARVAVGMRAALALPALSGRRFEGTLAWIQPALSAETRTARVRIELPNADHALRPDMLAEVQLDAAASERLLVPLSAVIRAGERSFVFLDLGEGRLRPAPVEVGMRSGEEIEVLAGLEAGQSVVASATFLVASESRLRAALDSW